MLVDDQHRDLCPDAIGLHALEAPAAARASLYELQGACHHPTKSRAG